MAQNYMQVCANLLKNNPQIMQNPQTRDAAAEFMNILQSGDVKAGEEMANRVLKNLGTTRQGFFQSLGNLFSRRN